MHSSVPDKNLIPVTVHVDDEAIHVLFRGGLEIAAPLSTSSRLQAGDAKSRKEWRLIGRGDGIHWPDVDKDLSIRGLLANATERHERAMPDVA